jgi:hypothetical protein
VDLSEKEQFKILSSRYLKENDVRPCSRYVNWSCGMRASALRQRREGQTQKVRLLESDSIMTDYFGYK